MAGLTLKRLIGAGLVLAALLLASSTSFLLDVIVNLGQAKGTALALKEEVGASDTFDESAFNSILRDLGEEETLPFRDTAKGHNDSCKTPAINPPPGCKKVVAVSLYGNNTRYTSMATVYARSIRVFAPDWSLWVYINPEKPSPSQTLREIEETGARVIVGRTDLSQNGMMWRFLAADDPSVSRLSVRDADARFTLREASSLRLWEESGLPFHAQRDHEAHFDMTLPLGGMWGAVASSMPHMETLMTSQAGAGIVSGVGWGTDMMFLREVLTPIMLRAGVLEHLPSIHCAPTIKHDENTTKAVLPYPRAGYEFLGSAGVVVNHMLGLERMPQAQGCPADVKMYGRWNRTTSRSIVKLPRPWEDKSIRAVGGVKTSLRVGDSATSGGAYLASNGPQASQRMLERLLSLSAAGPRKRPPLGDVHVMGRPIYEPSSEILVTAIHGAFVTLVAPTAETNDTRLAAVHHYRSVIPLQGGASRSSDSGALVAPAVLSAVPFFHEQFAMGYFRRTAYDEGQFIVVPSLAVILLRNPPPSRLRHCNKTTSSSASGAAAIDFSPRAQKTLAALVSVLSTHNTCFVVVEQTGYGGKEGIDFAGISGGALTAAAASNELLAPLLLTDRACLHAPSVSRVNHTVWADLGALPPPDTGKDLTWYARDIIVVSVPMRGAADEAGCSSAEE